MEKFVREKRFWIYTKLAEKEALAPAAPTKKYVAAKASRTSARSYRLLLVDRQDLPVRLDHGRFVMLRTEAEHGRAQMIRWYTDRARTWLEKRVARYQARVGVEPVAITVQDLGFRWGSCGKGGRLNFHWRSILLPPWIIEYRDRPRARAHPGGRTTRPRSGHASSGRSQTSQRGNSGSRSTLLASMCDVAQGVASCKPHRFAALRCFQRVS